MKKKLSKKILIISILSLMQMSLFINPAFAERKCLSVPILQGSENCGAACASMITNYFEGDTVNREQAAWLARWAYNQNCPIHDGYGEWWNCTSYYAVQALADQQGGDYYHLGNLSLSTVKTKITAETPIAISVMTYLGEEDNGHCLAVKGYNTGSDNTGDNIIYNDPYNGNGVSASLAWIESNWDTSGKAYWK